MRASRLPRPPKPHAQVKPSTKPAPLARLPLWDSSDEEGDDSPCIRAVRPTGFAEAAVRGNLLFEKMGVTVTDSGFDSDSSWDSTPVPARSKAALRGGTTPPAPATAADRRDGQLDRASATIAALQQDLAAARAHGDAASAQLHHAEAQSCAASQRLAAAESEVAALRLAATRTAPAPILSDEALQAKAELLERQLSALRASNEQSQAERAALARANSDLQRLLHSGQAGKLAPGVDARAPAELTSSRDEEVERGAEEVASLRADLVTAHAVQRSMELQSSDAAEQMQEALAQVAAAKAAAAQAAEDAHIEREKNAQAAARLSEGQAQCAAAEEASAAAQQAQRAAEEVAEERRMQAEAAAEQAAAAREECATALEAVLVAQQALGEQQAQLEAKSDELEAVWAALSAAEGALEEAQQGAEQGQQELVGRSQLDAAVQQRDAAHSSVEVMRRQLAAARAELRARTQQHADADAAAAAKVQAQMQGLQAELDRQVADAAAAHVALQQAQASEAAAVEEAVMRRQEVEDLRGQLAALKAALVAAASTPATL